MQPFRQSRPLVAQAAAPRHVEDRDAVAYSDKRIAYGPPRVLSTSRRGGLRGTVPPAGLPPVVQSSASISAGASRGGLRGRGRGGAAGRAPIPHRAGDEDRDREWDESRQPPPSGPSSARRQDTGYHVKGDAYRPGGLQGESLYDASWAASGSGASGSRANRAYSPSIPVPTPPASSHNRFSPLPPRPRSPSPPQPRSKVFIKQVLADAATSYKKQVASASNDQSKPASSAPPPAMAEPEVRKMKFKPNVPKGKGKGKEREEGNVGAAPHDQYQVDELQNEKEDYHVGRADLGKEEGDLEDAADGMGIPLINDKDRLEGVLAVKKDEAPECWVSNSAARLAARSAMKMEKTTLLSKQGRKMLAVYWRDDGVGFAWEKIKRTKPKPGPLGLKDSPISLDQDEDTATDISQLKANAVASSSNTKAVSSASAANGKAVAQSQPITRKSPEKVPMRVTIVPKQSVDAGILPINMDKYRAPTSMSPDALTNWAEGIASLTIPPKYHTQINPPGKGYIDWLSYRLNKHSGLVDGNQVRDVEYRVESRLLDGGNWERKIVLYSRYFPGCGPAIDPAQPKSGPKSVPSDGPKVKNQPPPKKKSKSEKLRELQEWTDKNAAASASTVGIGNGSQQPDQKKKVSKTETSATTSSAITGGHKQKRAWQDRASEEELGNQPSNTPQLQRVQQKVAESISPSKKAKVQPGSGPGPSTSGPRAAFTAAKAAIAAEIAAAATPATARPVAYPPSAAGFPTQTRAPVPTTQHITAPVPSNPFTMPAAPSTFPPAPAPAPIAVIKREHGHGHGHGSMSFHPALAPAPIPESSHHHHPSPSPIPVLSERLNALRNEMNTKLTAIDNWTKILEDYPDRAASLGKRIEMYEAEIFNLQSEIESEKRRLA